jgi:putative flavoprotein involved in K+ transport
MNERFTDVIIVGAGHAGLCASYYLQQAGVDHVVFERGKVGESWRSQRWDSFVLNTANKFNGLPGAAYEGDEPDGFAAATTYVAALDAYVQRYRLPVQEYSRVLAIDKPGSDVFFHVTVLRQNTLYHYRCKQVIIASGIANEKSIPALATAIDKNILQLHAGEYRNPDQLPQGAVLVAGSAQSGCQVAEDLADAGRKVFLSTSMVARLPRRYRGKDIMEWLSTMRFFDMRVEDLEDPSGMHMKAPQLTGRDGGQRSISLQSLAKRGITILGKMEKAEGQMVQFQPNAAMHVQFADGFSQQVKGMIDQFIAGAAVTAPAPAIDAADIPDTTAACASSITSLNLAGHHIRAVIWATGFGCDFNYIKLPVFDEEGLPQHRDGITAIPGLYFVGLAWMRSRKSGILFGMQYDAEFIVQQVQAYAQAHAHRQAKKTPLP